MTEKKEKESGGKTRREFLKDAGLLVGGTAIGSTVLLAACGGGETTTVTQTGPGTTVTNTATVTAGASTVTDTVTTTVGAGQTATETVTTTQTTSRFICPVDGMEFDTLAELQAHFEANHPEGIPGLVTLIVNGKVHIVKSEDSWSLLYVLREKLGLTGAKAACETGDCGVCTINMDGRPVLSCLVLAKTAQGKDIQTVEGMATGDELTPLQQAFIDKDGLECGFCTPGMLMSAKALLDFKSNPTPDEVREFLAGNLCKCGMYHSVVDAVIEAGG
jgi:aerobic-type carbon monoxide dehydrogenase small subunit (CoxS/CutS family)